MYLFSMDNPFFRFVGKLTDIVWINILTLICCLPVFTAGAAFSAMYHVLIHMALKEESVITVPFFREFKANFKKATVVWLPSLVILIIMGLNCYYIYMGALDPYPKLLLFSGISIGIITIVVIVFLNYYFAIIARYENELRNSIKNAFLMMIAYLPRSISIIIICAFPFALMTLSDYFLIFWFVYGLSVPGYFNAMVLGNLFVKTDRAEKASDDME